MYGYDYAYEPATEGLAEIGNWITEKINAGKEMIKKLIDDVKAKLRRMSRKADDVKANTTEVIALIGSITSDTDNILKKTGEAIDKMYEAAAKLQKTSDLPDEVKARKELAKKGAYITANARMDSDENGNTVSTKGKYFELKRGGINNIRSDASATDKESWTSEMTKEGGFGRIFNEQLESAEKVKANLNKLSSYGPLTYTETEQGYNSLREYFATNQTVMNKWLKLKTAVDWSIGNSAIHSTLKKIFNLYDVGLKATNAFGKRLTSGNFRKEDGTKYDAKDRKAMMKRQASERNLDKALKGDFKDRTSVSHGSFESASYVLDRLYQVAYEDALNDIADEAYYEQVFESVPDYMPGFDEYLEDAEYYPDNY